ncbi:MAG TPA: MFS transporter [Ktedonobacteraceae bacterium]|jgi:MFS family permease
MCAQIQVLPPLSVALSLLLGLTSSSVLLIALRARQGLAAAFMASTALAILLTTFEEGERRNWARSVWSMVSAGSAAVGVFLGGVLTQYLGWQWCFFVDVPAGILAIVGILKYVPAQRQDASERPLDRPDTVLVTGGLIALVYALTLVSQVGWTDPEHVDDAGCEHHPASCIPVQRGQGEASADATRHLSEPEREWW